MIEVQEKILQEITAKAQARCSVKLNDDVEKFVVPIVKGLCKNYKYFKHYLCPCRPRYIALEDPEGFSCPCKNLEADITEKGHCTCKLFIKAD